MDTIGADHEASRNQPLPVMAIFEPHTADAAIVRADQIDELGFEHESCTGFFRRFDKEPVNDSPPRCVEALNVVLRFDLHGDRSRLRSEMTWIGPQAYRRI